VELSPPEAMVATGFEILGALAMKVEGVGSRLNPGRWWSYGCWRFGTDGACRGNLVGGSLLCGI
jgi:hypothetical protein